MRGARHLLILLAIGGALAACAGPPKQDLTQLKARDPINLLVLPPDNQSPDLMGTYTFLSTISRPLAERGYYVQPVAVVDAYIRANGITDPSEMNTIPLDKLVAQFRPDAVLYTQINYFGQKFAITRSFARIDADLRLIDAESGAELWRGRVYFDEAQQQQQNAGGLLGQVLVAAITQAIGAANPQRFFGFSQSANTAAVKSLPQGALLRPEG